MTGAGDVSEIVAAAARAADLLFEGAAVRDERARFPDDAMTVLRDAGLMMAPFPTSCGGAGLTEHDAVDDLRAILRLVGGADLSVGRLYEGHVNAVALVQRYGTARQLARLADVVEAGAMSGVWNAEGSRPAMLGAGPSGVRLGGAKILCSGAGSITHPLVPVRRGEAIVMVMPHIAQGERTDLSGWTAQGMRSTATGTIDLDGLVVDADAIVGSDDDYSRQPVFFGGAWRFCAVQLGAIERLLDLFRAELSARGRGDDPFQRQRVAISATAAETASLWVREASRMVAAEVRPTRDILAYVGLTRGVVERAALDVIEAVQRGLGLGSFVRPHPVERVARDLATYLRQPAPDGAMADAAGSLLTGSTPARALWRRD